MKLRNKVAVVTGASRGIGHEVAVALAAEGAHIIAIARTIGGLEELDDRINKAGGSATLVPLDITDTAKLQALGPNLLSRYNQIDYLVSAAGYLDKLTSVAQSNADFWAKTMATNVTANITLIQTLHPLLKNAPNSRSLFLRADPALNGKPFWGYYNGSYAALKTIVDSYAEENPDMWIKTFVPYSTQTRLRDQAYPGLKDEGQTPAQTARQIVDYLLAA